VGGHTGKYPGCGFTIVGGGVLLGTAGRDGYLTPAMARDGDVVLMSKGTAIETTAVLARAFPETVKERLGKEMARRAAEYLHLCSTVDDALAAASIGVGSEGVTAMHDATEGGILGGLHEFALSCGLTLVAEEARIHVSDESRGICKLFRLDPLVTLSEGTLIMACGKNRASAVQEALKKKKIDSFLIGELKRGTPGLWVRRKGRAENVTPPEHDPYWAAYIEGIRRKWA
jgi:hydrogenase maturation factor